MKEAAPRIFRSLELPNGTGDFDTIVAAAVAAYGSLRSPSDRQARDFGRLVAPLWRHIRLDTRRAVAASLSHATNVPRILVDRLLAEPVEVAAPFLVSSPVLSAADLTGLTASRDPRLVRIVEGRQARLSPLPERAATQTPSTPAVSTRKPLPTVAAPTIAADFVGEPNRPAGTAEAGAAASLARDTLRRLALTGRRKPEAPVAPPSLDGLYRHARTRAETAFYETLARLLVVDDDRLTAIANEPTGTELAAALKALHAGEADALTVLMLMKPSVGLDVAAFEAMTRDYRGLDPEGCRRSFWGLSSAPVRTPAEPRRPRIEREQPRAEFGRRKVRPVETQREKKGS